MSDPSWGIILVMKPAPLVHPLRPSVLFPLLWSLSLLACAPDGPQMAEDGCAAYQGDEAVYAVCITRSATLEGDLTRAASRCDLLAAPGNVECRTRWVELNAANPAYSEESLRQLCMGSDECDAAVAVERRAKDVEGGGEAQGAEAGSEAMTGGRG